MRGRLLDDWLVRICVAPTLGLLASVGFSPFGIPLALVVAFAGLFYLIEACKRPLEAAGLGWLFGLGYFSMGLSWTFNSMNVYGGLSAPVAMLGVLALAGALATIPMTVCFLGRMIRVTPAVRVGLLLPVLWTLGELVRGVWLMGFGWLSVGYAFVDSIYAGWAPVLGVYGVTLAVLLTAGSAVAVFVGQRAPLGKMLLAGMLGSIALGSLFLHEMTWSHTSGFIETRLLQPNLPVVASRISATTVIQRVERAVSMSSRSPIGRNLDLIVWPESVFAVPLQKMPLEVRPIASQISKRMNAVVLFNAFSEYKPGVIYNSMWMADPEKSETTAHYAKRHLVPFGEYVPAGFRWLIDLLGIPMADQTPGELLDWIGRVEGKPMAMGICYENMFPEEVRQWWQIGEPEVIVFSANLGWFGESAADQYTQMSQMRALETARPVLQALNNAQSAYINAHGAIETIAGDGAQNLDARVLTMVGSPTPFVRFGHWLLIGILALLLILCFVPLPRSRFRFDRERLED